MFCKYCGNKIDDDSVFCQHCGKRLAEDSSNFRKESGDSSKYHKEAEDCPTHHKEEHHSYSYGRRKALYHIGQLVSIIDTGKQCSIKEIIFNGDVPTYKTDTGAVFFESELEVYDAQLSPPNASFPNNALSQRNYDNPPTPNKHKVANTIVNEFRANLKMIGLSALLLFILLAVFCIYRYCNDLGDSFDNFSVYDSSLGDYYTGIENGRTLKDMRLECFYSELGDIAKRWGIIFLLTTIVGRYVVKGIKWVNKNKS
ncbi:MAG: zinc ribbon domain-containing protein [Bacteroidales bacterium]|nr:zinc ribbon domain-containing protein [Bacteroidales bacterium]